MAAYYSYYGKFVKGDKVRLKEQIFVYASAFLEKNRKYLLIPTTAIMTITASIIEKQSFLPSQNPLRIYDAVLDNGDTIADIPEELLINDT